VVKHPYVLQLLLRYVNYLSTIFDKDYNLIHVIMKKNMGSVDKLLRLAFAAIVAVLYFMGIVSGILGIVLLGIALVFAVTSFMSFCPLYVPFGINTCSKKEK